MAADVRRKSRRVGGGNMVIPSVLQGVQFELANEQLKALALQQDLAGRGVDVVALIDRGAVDADRDGLPRAQALDPRPFAEGTLDVVLTAGVEQFLELRIVQRPPQLAASEDARFAALP